MKLAKLKPRGKSGPIRKPGLPVSKKLNIKGLPLPAYEQILLYLAANYKCVLDFALTCKKFFDVAKQSQQHWFQLSLLHFQGELAKTYDVEELMALQRRNQVHPGVHWLSFFLTQRQRQQERKRKSMINRFGKIFQSSSYDVAYYKARWEAITCNFYICAGKSVSLIPSENCTFFHTGLCVFVELPEQPKRLPSLQVETQGVKIDLQPPKLAVLSPGQVSLAEADGVMACTYTTGEVCFLVWNLNYFALAQKVVGFAYPQMIDDLDSLYGLRSYYLMIEIRDCERTYEVLALRNIDLKVSGAVAVASIDCTNQFPPLPTDLALAWRTAAFSDKFQGACVMDTLLRSEFGDIVWSGCRGTKLRPLPHKSKFDGETFTLPCEDEKGSVSLTLQKTESGYELKKAHLSVKLSEIEKMYVRCGLVSHRQ